MDNEKEIEALLSLIDDPDTEVFNSVENRLKYYGTPVIPHLENLWENTISEEVQHKIEMIIHGIHFRSLKAEFIKWQKSECELIHGALLVAKYQYPELQTLTALQEIERMRRSVWLEIHSYMTPLEQIKIVETILYNFYKLKGGEIAYEYTNEFMLNKVVEGKKGNSISCGILYLILTELLDLPVRVINLPQQFVLAWFSAHALFENKFPMENAESLIKFYIDPNSGIAFSHKDVALYLKRINHEPEASFFQPMTNKQIIKLLLEQFALCFEESKYNYKKQELTELANMLLDE